MLGPEMKSTGEVMGVADTFGEAFAKAQLPPDKCCPRSVRFHQRQRSRQAVHGGTSATLCRAGLQPGGHTRHGEVIEDAGLRVERVFKVKEGRPNVVDLIKGERIQLIMNTPHGIEPWFDEKAIRRAAVIARIPTITTLSAARAACEGIAALKRGEVKVYALATTARRARYCREIDRRNTSVRVNVLNHCA